MIKHANRLATAGFDAIAIKPSSQSITSIDPSQIDAIVIDFEGPAHLPDPNQVAELSEESHVTLTAPVRADGFDPLGDDGLFDQFEEADRFALVAGNGAYLTEGEQRKAIAPRLGRAIKRYPDAWVGTEGIERLALATGASQFELLSPDTPNMLTGLRSAGFDGEIALYAPTVVTDDRQVALSELKSYLSRRRRVKRALSNGSATHTDPQDVLLQAMDDYALVGDESSIAQQIESLKTAGATTVVGYPAGTM